MSVFSPPQYGDSRVISEKILEKALEKLKANVNIKDVLEACREEEEKQRSEILVEREEARAHGTSQSLVPSL